MPRKTAAERHRLRHARRITRFFEQAARGRVIYREEQRTDRIAPHLDAWCEIVDTRNPSRPGAPDAP